MTYPELDKLYLVVSNPKEIHYQIYSKHRGSKPTTHASVWTVNNDSEVACFREAVKKGYLVDNDGWGYILGSAGLITLGECVHSGNIVDEVKLAKFKDGSCNQEWHGWPCNYKRTGDTPPDEVLEKWVNEKIITKVKMQKIKQKQRCSL